MVELPPLDEDLVRRLERVGDEFMVRWLELQRDHPGDDDTGQLVERFGGVVATARPSSPGLDFANKVYGLGPEGEREIDPILDFYRGLGIRPWFELAPLPGFDVLAERLARAGAQQIDFHAVLYGAPQQGDRSKDVEVREIGSEDAGVFAETHLEGHEVPRPAWPVARRSVERWHEVPGWRLYLAFVDGEPAASAVLTLTGDHGYLANAATVPRARGRGCQTALIRTRIADAIEAGCTLVSSGCAFLSASHRNLERAGLHVAYTKAVWRLR